MPNASARTNATWPSLGVCSRILFAHSAQARAPLIWKYGPVIGLPTGSAGHLQLVASAVDSSLTGNVRGLNGGDLAVNGVNLNATQLGYFDQLQAQGAITAYTAEASEQGSAQSPHPVSRFDIRLVDPARYPLAGTPTFDAPQDGRMSATLDSTSIVLTHSLAQEMNAHVGDRFTVTLADGHAGTVTVGGIVANGGLFQQPLLIMAYGALAPFGESATLPLLYDVVYADVPGHSADRATVVQQEIRGQFPNAEVMTADNLLQNNQQEVDSIQSFLRAVGLVALLIGGMGIVNTMRVLLRRRTTEIAMLKAEGYKPRHLLALLGLEAGLLGLLGGAIGAAAGNRRQLRDRWLCRAGALARPARDRRSTGRRGGRRDRRRHHAHLRLAAHCAGEPDTAYRRPARVAGGRARGELGRHGAVGGCSSSDCAICSRWRSCATRCWRWRLSAAPWLCWGCSISSSHS